MELLLLVLLQVFFASISAVDDSVTNCASRFPSTLSNENESELDQHVNYLSYGYYIFPLLKFQCGTNVTGILGYFLVNYKEHDYHFYFQIWRPDNTATIPTIHLVKEIELDFADEYSNCQNATYARHVQCFINYTLSTEINVEDHDFIGFYTSDNSLARPLFNETKTKTQLGLLSSVTNANTINGRTEYSNSSFPQIIVLTQSNNNNNNNNNSNNNNNNNNSQAHAKQGTMQKRHVYAIISVSICVTITIIVVIVIVVFKRNFNCKSLVNRNPCSYRKLLEYDEAQQSTPINDLQGSGELNIKNSKQVEECD